VQLAADHFVKVRALIKDLIQKLKDDAKSEATQKNTCDKGMASAISDRDTANARKEVANAKITTLTANKNALEDEMASLAAQIAALKKEFNEATELRNGDKADNADTVRMAAEGGEAVTLALGLLKNFYDNAFVQTSKYTPPNAGRDGKNVDDLAPAFNTDKYAGAGAESGGIVGILEVILSDFQRTKKTAEKDEKEQQDAFDEMEKETDRSVNKKDKRINKADGQKTEAEGNILEQEQALNDANKMLDTSLAALEDLEAMCVKGEETYEERTQKRKDEINALKEALEIFEDWQA